MGNSYIIVREQIKAKTGYRICCTFFPKVDDFQLLTNGIIEEHKQDKIFAYEISSPIKKDLIGGPCIESKGVDTAAYDNGSVQATCAQFWLSFQGIRRFFQKMGKRFLHWS